MQQGSVRTRADEELQLSSAQLSNHSVVAVVHIKPVIGFFSPNVFGSPGKPDNNAMEAYARYVAVVNRGVFQGNRMNANIVDPTKKSFTHNELLRGLFTAH